MLDSFFRSLIWMNGNAANEIVNTIRGTTDKGKVRGQRRLWTDVFEWINPFFHARVDARRSASYFKGLRLK